MGKTPKVLMMEVDWVLKFFYLQDASLVIHSNKDLTEGCGSSKI